MILLIDEDTATRNLLQRILKSDGHNVMLFHSTLEAIAYLRSSEPPKLIVSDIVMPEMDGFTFQSEVKKIKKHAHVPFVFLSSLADEETMVKGLNKGADDYLLKPIQEPLFRAKVRAILRKRCHSSSPVFCGTLEKLPFTKIFQFCESKGLSGQVKIESESLTTTLQFIRGELDYESLEDGDETLDKLYGLTKGTFRTSQYLTSFEEIQDAALSSEEEPKRTHESKPMGMLSGIKINQKLVQVQTEYRSTPTPFVNTIVVYDGKTIHNKVNDAVAYLNREELEAVIRTQHQRVEAHIREKLAKSAEEAPEKKDTDFNRLFDQGLEHYMKKEYDHALAIWSQAYELNPDHKLLNINLKVLKKKQNSANS